MNADAVLGIDPGSRGAAVLITVERDVHVCRFLDKPKRQIVEHLAYLGSMHHLLAGIERVNDRPGHATQNTFAYGRNYGFIETTLITMQAFGVLHTDIIWVEAKTWQYEFNLGGKQGPAGCTEAEEYRARKRAHQVKAKDLFKVDITQDLCDAYLIAEYLWRLTFGSLTYGKKDKQNRPGEGIRWSEI